MGVVYAPCMLWPIVSLQVGLAVQCGPFCKGYKHGLSQWTIAAASFGIPAGEFVHAACHI